MAKKKRTFGPVKLLITKILVTGFSWFFSLFSWEKADAIGVRLGRLLLLLGVRKKVVMENLNFVFASKTTPDNRRKTAREIDDICRGCYETFGTAIVSYMRYKLLTPDFFKTHCTYENMEILDDLLKEGKGIVVLGAHIGGWEYVMTCASSIGYNISLIAKTIPNPYLNDLVISYRLKNNLKSIPPKDSRDRVLKALSENELIALVFDQNMPGRRGIFVDVFGKAASTVKSTAGIVRDSKAPVVGGVMRRVGPAKYHMKIYPQISWIKHENWERERFLNTQKWAKFIEEAILEAPEQWFWLHKRWKRRPEDEEETETQIKEWNKDL